MQVEDVRLLLLPEQDVGGFGLSNAVSCCMQLISSTVERGCL